MSAASGYATLCNFENSLQCRTLTAMQQAQRDLFVHYAPKNPDILWVDVDRTPIYVYGNREYKEFSGHYGDYCLIAMVIFINNFPVYVTLDRGCQDERAMLEEVCEETIDFLREHYPGTAIVFRADSGFARVHQVTREEHPRLSFVFTASAAFRSASRNWPLTPFGAQSRRRMRARDSGRPSTT